MYQIRRDLKEVHIQVTAGTMTILKAERVAKELGYKLVFITKETK